MEVDSPSWETSVSTPPPSNEGKSMGDEQTRLDALEDTIKTLHAQNMACRAVVQALMLTIPDTEAFKTALLAAREDAHTVLADVGRDGNVLPAVADASLRLEHQLFVLTAGLVGEAPGAPTPSNPRA